MARISPRLVRRSIDATPIAVVALVGVVAIISIGGPMLGYLAAMLTMPTGILSIVLLALSLVVIGMLVSETERAPCPLCAEERASDRAGATGLVA